jgi:hypothetical protein
MPAGWTGVSDVPRVGAPPGNVGNVQRRSDRRAELKLARRSRQRWAVLASSILVASFGVTVGILDVLH